MPSSFSERYKKLPAALKLAAAALLCLLFSLVLPAAFGFTFGGQPLKNALEWQNVLFAAALLFAFSSWKPSRLLLALPFILAAAAYYPAAVLYGKPNFLIAIALLQTTPSEAGEFLSNTPWRLFAEAAGILLLGLAAVWAVRRSPFRKTLGQCAFAAALVLAFSLCYDGKTYKLQPLQSGNFLWSLAENAWSGYSELKTEAEAPAPDWKIAAVHPRYRDYVIVIGESQRRDYASVYGYSLDTTPFLNKAKGVFFTNFAAPGGNTGISLPRLLSVNFQGKDSFHRADNILTLASAAGFDTWWISNQGRGGAFDNPIAQIGVRAAHTVWLKGNYADPNVDDDELLPKFETALKTENPEGKPRLFILHLMGSHPTFCTRVAGRDSVFRLQDQSMDCYLTTYRMMDSLLEKAVGTLKENSRSWSLLYFADHGLSMVKKPGTDSGAELEHGYDHRENYDVPFFLLSSDSTAHEVNAARRSGFRLIEGAADWFGITTPTIPVWSTVPFWSREDDPEVMVFGKKKYSSLKSDPAAVFPQAP